MRIVHVIGSLHPRSGGPPVVALNLAAAQAEAGHNVTILCPDRDTKQGETAALVASVLRGRPVAVVGGIRVSPLAALLPGPLSATAEECVAGADWVHLHSLWEPIIAAVAACAFGQGIPYCITPHGVLEPWSLRQRRLKKRLALALGYRRVLERAAFLQCLTRREGLGVRGLLHGNASVCLVPNGVTRQSVSEADREAFFARVPELRGARFLLTLGRLHPVKGLDLLVRAFGLSASRHPSLMLALAGPDEGSERELRELAAQLGLSSRVAFVGAVYGEAKRGAFGAAHAFCQTSHQEGFSMALLEAMSSGLPVIATEACDFGPVASEELGWVIPSTVDAIASAIDAVAAEPAAAEARGARGRAWVETHARWDSVAEQLVVAYRQNGGEKRGTH